MWCTIFIPEGLEGDGLEPAGDMAGDANPAQNFKARVMDEDGSAMPGIQRGLRSRTLAPGKLFWLEEPVLRRYQRLARELVD